MQIDIGFGDVITPGIEEYSYPNLLDFPGSKLKIYPQETLITEKIQTMVEKGESNSRIKDFYDVCKSLHIFWLIVPNGYFGFHKLSSVLNAMSTTP